VEADVVDREQLEALDEGDDWLQAEEGADSLRLGVELSALRLRELPR
jgi:hypothetical protein